MDPCDKGIQGIRVIKGERKICLLQRSLSGLIKKYDKHPVPQTVVVPEVLIKHTSF